MCLSCSWFAVDAHLVTNEAPEMAVCCGDWIEAGQSCTCYHKALPARMKEGRQLIKIEDYHSVHSVGRTVRNARRSLCQVCARAVQVARIWSRKSSLPLKLGAGISATHCPYRDEDLKFGTSTNLDDGSDCCEACSHQHDRRLQHQDSWQLDDKWEYIMEDCYDAQKELDAAEDLEMQELEEAHRRQI